MNCKQGDLAYVVRSYAGNEGRIVRCVRLLPCKRWRLPNGVIFTEPSWVIDCALAGWTGGLENSIPDHQLRPITPPPGTVTDEEVRKLFSPDRVTA